MNVYSKLAKARVELQNLSLKKSGKNKHLNFDYYELDDFLPAINAINQQLGLLPVFSINDTGATLTVYDTEGDTHIVFTSPVAHAKLQGNASAIQELGSQHTYMRRYMYLLAYEITEHDTLDPSIGNNTTPTQKPVKTDSKQSDKITSNQALEFTILCEQKGKNVLDIVKYFKLNTLADMTKQQLTAVLDKWEKEQ